MKRFLTLLLFTLITAVSFAQKNYQDVVYLKNGSIIRGVIIEQVPSKSLKIETVGKSVFVYKMDEIEKITKEKPPKSNDRKGYIGLTIGTSIPVGDFADKRVGIANTGVQINLINFGYRFSENVGIAATWFGAANPIDDDNAKPWSFGGIMVGPLFTFPLSKEVVWDIRPMVGYSLINSPEIQVDNGFSQYTIKSEEASSFAFNIGTVVRFNIGSKVILLVSADYFSAKPEFKNLNFVQPVETVSLGIGLAYRLK